MTDTATPFEGPVDAPASADSIASEIAGDIDAGTEGPQDAQAIADELVKEAEGDGQADEAPETEDDATEPEEVEGDEPEAETPESTPDDQLVTVKVNGEERQVPLSEAIAGYSRTEDYKAKTAAVAEQRREAEAAIANANAQAQAKYANELKEATELFAQYDPVLLEAQKIDWNALKQADPAAYVQAQDAVQSRLTAIQQMQQRAEQARGEAQQHQQQQEAAERAKRFDTAADEIVKAMPELADEARFQTFASDVIGHLQSEGFNQDEIANNLDHRVMRLADKARRWDAHQAAQKSLPEKKVVPRSAVKALTTDGGSRAPKPRFPANAERERKGNWIAEQIVAELGG